MTRVHDEPCIILHARAYRETSLILSGLTLNHGRVSLMARGARNGKRGRVLQPLNCLAIGFSGRSAMLNLNAFEVQLQPLLSGDALASGMYLAELTTRLLSERESHPRLFAGFYWALENLGDDIEPVLRSFEKLLLQELGYGLDFKREASNQTPIQPDCRYRFDPLTGFEKSQLDKGFSGASILAIGRGEFDSPEHRKIAKRIFRQALAAHLGSKPLMSRRLLFTRKQL